MLFDIKLRYFEMSVFKILKAECFFRVSEWLNSGLTLLHSERPKFYGVLAVLSAIGLISHQQREYSVFQISRNM